MSAIAAYKQHCEMVSAIVERITKYREGITAGNTAPGKFIFTFKGYSGIELFWNVCGTESTHLFMRALCEGIKEEWDALIKKALASIDEETLRLKKAAEDEAIAFLKGDL